MQYELKGGNFPVVVCQLENGEKMITEKGAILGTKSSLFLEIAEVGLARIFSIAIPMQLMIAPSI